MQIVSTGPDSWTEQAQLWQVPVNSLYHHRGGDGQQ